MSAAPNTISGELHLSLEMCVLDSMSVAVIATRSDGQIIFWSRFAEQLYGWRAQEVIGQNIRELLIPPEETAKAAETMAAVRSGESWTREFQLKRKDGALFRVLVTGSPFSDASGKMIGLVSVSHELSRARLEMERRVQERTAELQAANDSLRELSAALMRVRDDEGRRLARELHDSVGQLITAISMDLGMVSARAAHLDSHASAALKDSEALLKQLSSEVRTISHLLHPPLLDALGLVSALEVYVTGFAERSQITTDLRIAETFGRLPADIEMAIFRMVQEGLTNIHRHSKATRARIIVEAQDGRVCVDVHDNGSGMTSDQLARLSAGANIGVGLTGIRERIRRFGGTLEVKSDSTGTTLTAMFPVPRPRSDRMSETVNPAS